MALQLTNLIRLHAKATHHIEEYSRLSRDRKQSKALEHLREVNRIHSQIRSAIEGVKSTTVHIA